MLSTFRRCKNASIFLSQKRTIGIVVIILLSSRIVVRIFICQPRCLNMVSKSVSKMYVRVKHSRMTLSLSSSLEKIDNFDIFNQVESFCDLLCAGLIEKEIDSELPEFFVSSNSDEMYYEWIFDDFRFGFLFSKNRNESGWFLVTKVGGNINRFSDSFRGKETVDKILNYVKANYD